MQLKKLTTRYVAPEDRFLISAESDRGNINLWLTQRLIKSLLPHLLEWSGRHVDKNQASTTGPNENQAHQHRDATNAGSPQMVSQLVAQTRKPVVRVDPTKASQTVLVQTVQLQLRDDVLRLIFELPEEPAVLLLQSEHLRIWLGALYDGWQQAEWPDVWPEWMKHANRVRSQYPVGIMH
jgi:hypothetical protein